MKRIPTQPIALFLLGAILLMVPALISLNGYGGQILIARDTDEDSPFQKTLILLDHHNADGAVGIVINKPLTGAQRAELPPFLRDTSVPVGYGGPIGFPERIIVLEQKKPKKSAPGKIWFDLNDWDDVVNKTPGLLDQIKQDFKNGNQHYRVFAGIVAWAPFQLETEIGIDGAWYSIAPSHDLVFQNGPGTSWDTLFQQEENKKKTGIEDKT
jgi:putative transcriptional regulator